MAEKLPTDQFMRIHRSYIISISKVTSFVKGYVHLDKTSIPVGITYQNRVFESLK